MNRKSSNELFAYCITPIVPGAQRARLDDSRTLATRAALICVPCTGLRDSVRCDKTQTALGRKVVTNLPMRGVGVGGRRALAGQFFRATAGNCRLPADTTPEQLITSKPIGFLHGGSNNRLQDHLTFPALFRRQ